MCNEDASNTIRADVTGNPAKWAEDSLYVTARKPLHPRLDNPMTTHFHRRSIRQKDYDYMQNGAYFVTLCTQERGSLFGQVVDGAMVVNAWGQIVQSCWDEIPAHYPMVELDAFVVMPNHVHGVIVITNDPGAASNTIGNDRRGMACHAPTNGPVTREFAKPIPGSLPTIVGAFKSAVTKHINRLPDAPDQPIWQRNYHEHIIRNEDALNTIRAYITGNPAKWAEDSLFIDP
jgi:putative transposase